MNELEMTTEIIDDDNVIRLVKPIGDRNELIFDFEKINGRTLLQCEKVARQEDAGMLIPALSTVFQAVVAGKALGMKYDDIINLSAPDFIAVTQKVSRFLNNVGKSKI
ncbi:MAG: hypothetical protein IJ728_03135 [Selenomonadaceae bacterium]|nr:hypothetical protein [Selenomonadaceae bacterium]